MVSAGAIIAPVFAMEPSRSRKNMWREFLVFPSPKEKLRKSSLKVQRFWQLAGAGPEIRVFSRTAIGELPARVGGLTPG